MAEFDTVIRGGTIVDGTLLPPFKADIGIKDGRIATGGAAGPALFGVVLFFIVYALFAGAVPGALPGRSIIWSHLAIYLALDTNALLGTPMKVGATIVSADNAPIAPGNTLPLSGIPTGTSIHNVELQPGRGGQLLALITI